MAEAGDDITMARLLKQFENWDGPRQPNGMPDLSGTPAFGRKGFGEFVKEFGPDIAIDAGTMAAGPIGRGVSAVAGAMRSAPKMSAALLGALGFGASTTEAEDASLTKRQQRQLEINRQEQARKLEAERVRAEIEANAQKQAAEQGLAIEMARKQQEDEFARQQAARDAVKPFRETHSQLNAAIPYLAGGTALAVPALMRGGQTLAQALKVPGWRNAVAETKAAIDSGNVAKATLGARELDAYNAAHAAQGGLGKTLTAAGAGGAAGTEVSMIPAQSDWYSLPAGNPDREAGKEQATNPIELAKRMAMLSALGATGYKLGGVIPGRTAPVEQSQSMAGMLREGLGDEAAMVGRNIAAMRGQSALPQSAATRLEPLPHTALPSGSGGLGGSASLQSAERGLPSPQSTGPQSLAAALKGGGTSGQSGASQSSRASASPQKDPHWVRQNREKGKFAEGFKDED